MCVFNTIFFILFPFSIQQKKTKLIWFHPPITNNLGNNYNNNTVNDDNLHIYIYIRMNGPTNNIQYKPTPQIQIQHHICIYVLVRSFVSHTYATTTTTTTNQNPKIISMENSRIRAKGTYRVIESKDYELIEEWNSIIAKENAKDETTWYTH